MDINEQIYFYGKKKFRFQLYGSIVKFVLLFLLMWLSVTLADSLFYFSEVTRWGLFIINIPYVAFLFRRLLYQPFKNWYLLEPNSDLSGIAIEIGDKSISIHDRLVNVYQLSKMQQTPLIRAAVSQIWQSITNKSFEEKIIPKNFLPNVKIIVPIISGVFILMFFLWPQISNSTLRLLNPNNDYLKVPVYSFIITPENTDILINQPLDIQAEFNGPQITGLNLLLYKDNKAINTFPLEKRRSGYHIRLKEATSSFQYIISAIPQLDNGLNGKLVSELFSVNVLIPPKVQELSVKTLQPKYTNSEMIYNEKNNGNIFALKGSHVELKATSNKVIKQAFLLFQNGDSVRFENRGKIVSGKFLVNNSTSYRISLIDIDGLSNQNPIEYTVNVLPDNPPYVNIVEPGEDIEAQLDGVLTVKVDAADDYGLRSVSIKYRYIKQSENADSSWHTLIIRHFENENRKAELLEFMDFSKFFVGYNDALEYYAHAIDNNNIEGYSKTNSPIYRITFPSLDELLEEFTQQEEEKVNDLENLAKESENLKEKLEEIRRELKRTDKVDWDLKKQIESSLDQHKKTQEDIAKIQDELDKMINKLDQNSLMDQQILEKYNQLQELFRDIASPELLDAMKNLQQAMEKSNPDDVKKALESFKMNQEEFHANLERALELFKQVQLEQQLDQLVQQAENLVNTQKKINENLAQEENEMAMKQAQQQQEQLESLQKNIERVSENKQLNSFPETREEMKNINSKINEEKLPEKTKRLEQQIKSQQQAQSQENSESLKQSFSDIQNNLNQTLQNMQQKNKQDVQKKMLSAAKKMLNLSHEQETVQRKTKDASQLNDDLQQLGREQSNIRENLSKVISDIIELSKETFFVDPQMNKSLTNAYQNMQQGMDALSERQNALAASKQLMAMQSLNLSVNAMQKSMQQLSGSESGTGFEQFMEQLQKMSGAQGQLNEESLNFMEGQGNKGQMESQRLAAQQKAIQQALSEMAEKTGNRSDILGRLNEMGEEMDEIVQDMLAHNVNRKTIDRQRQILSRMLDAQKSVREREYSKKRKAQQGKNYLAKNPGRIKDFEDTSQKELQEALKKALSEGYNSDYQKLIDSYFKQLSSKKMEKN